MNLNQIKIILKRYKIIISILVLCIFLGTSYAFYIDIQKEDKDIKVSSNKKLNSSKIPLGQDTFLFEKNTEIKIENNLDFNSNISSVNNNQSSSVDIIENKVNSSEINTKNNVKENVGGGNDRINFTPIPSSDIDPESKLPNYNNSKYLLDVLANLDPLNNYKFKYAPYDNGSDYPNTELITSIEGFDQKVFDFVWLKLFSKYITNLNEQGYSFSFVNYLDYYKENDVPLALIGTDSASPELRDKPKIIDYKKNINLEQFNFTPSEIYHIKIISLLYPELDPEFYNRYCSLYEHPNCNSGISKNLKNNIFGKNIKSIINKLGYGFKPKNTDAQTISSDFSLSLGGNSTIPSGLEDLVTNGVDSILSVVNLTLNTVLSEVAGQISTLQLRSCGAKRAVEGDTKPVSKLYSGVALCSICRNVLCLGIVPGIPPKITFYSYLWSIEYGARCGCSDGALPGF